MWPTKLTPKLSKQELYDRLARKGGDIQFLASVICRRPKPTKYLRRLHDVVNRGMFVRLQDFSLDMVYIQGEEEPMHYTEL